MSNYVVVGAGPIGLYTAIRLYQQGIPAAKIYVVDRRHGKYSRPGLLIEDIFHLASAVLPADRKIRPSSASHIKDLERGLYAYAVELGIQFESANFAGLQRGSKSILLSDGRHLPAAFVFDCSGSKRAVVNALNVILPTPHFHEEPLCEISIKGHLIAYGLMSTEHVTALASNQLALSATDKLQHIQVSFKPRSPEATLAGVLQLKALGWQYNALPTLHLTKLPSKNKVCLYMERPDSLSVDLEEVWVNTLINVYANKEDLIFNKMSVQGKYGPKPRFTPFHVTPKKIAPLYHTAEDGPSTLPHIIPLGDSQISPDYRLGHGIQSGIQRVNALIKTCEFYKGEIVYYDGEEFTAQVTPDIMNHTAAVRSLHSERTRTLQLDPTILNAVLTIEKIALKKLADPNPVINVMNDCLKALFNELYPHKERIDYHVLQSRSEEIDQWIIQQRMLMTTFLDACDIEAMKADLESLSHQLKETGNHCIRIKYYELAMRCYAFAIKIHHQILDHSKPAEEITLYSNALIALTKQGISSKLIIEFADEAIEKFTPLADFPTKQQRLQKIHHYRFLAIATQLRAQGEAPETTATYAQAQLETKLKDALSQSIIIPATVAQVQRYLAKAEMEAPSPRKRPISRSQASFFKAIALPVPEAQQAVDAHFLGHAFHFFY